MLKRIKKLIRPLYKSFLDLTKSFTNIVTEVKRIQYRLNRKSVIKEYLSNEPTKKLQIGGGSNPFKGWLNTDISPKIKNRKKIKNTIFLDATELFPFENSTFDYIFCEHMIEHINYKEGLFMLSECFRILKPGGKIRLSTPNLKVFLELFNNDLNEIQKNYLDWMHSNWLKKQNLNEKNPAYNLNLVMHAWGHQFVYDERTLKESLQKTGFSQVKLNQTNNSVDENLKDLELHGDFIGNVEMNNFETLVLEATK